MYWLRTRQHKHFVNQTHVSRLQDFEIIWTQVFLRTKSAFGVPNGFARFSTISHLHTDCFDFCVVWALSLHGSNRSSARVVSMSIWVIPDK